MKCSYTRTAAQYNWRGSLQVKYDPALNICCVGSQEEAGWSPWLETIFITWILLLFSWSHGGLARVKMEHLLPQASQCTQTVLSTLIRCRHHKLHMDYGRNVSFFMIVCYDIIFIWPDYDPLISGSEDQKSPAPGVTLYFVLNNPKINQYWPLRILDYQTK